MNKDLIITNAKIVTPTDVIDGSVVVTDGLFSQIDESMSDLTQAEDFEGDYLLPGFVELHTDNLEKHFKPRPGVSWPSEAAVMAHDAQMAISGVTTVLDAIRVGDTWPSENLRSSAKRIAQAIKTEKKKNTLRCEHLLHIRCEISCSDVIDQFEGFAEEKNLKLVSIMDHTPGQRQFVDEDKYREYYQGKYSISDIEIDRMIAQQKVDQSRYSRKHRSILVEYAEEIGVPLASHDDAIIAHVEEAAGEGVTISEFPTTLEAAHAARGHKMKVLMGAPNLVLGGSHSGNISAMELAHQGLLDILSSDYVPNSLLHGAFMVAHQTEIKLPEAIAMASLTPAKMVGLDDRGEISEGKKADLLRVKLEGDVPVIRSVWRDGGRVA